MDIDNFWAGLGVGLGLVGVESLVYALSIALSSIGNSSATLIFALLLITETLIIGFVSPKEFAVGFLVGDFVILILAGTVIYATMPSVIWSMVFAFVVVLLALIFRCYYGDDLLSQLKR